MPFGKYRGYEVGEIPFKYLKWLWNKVKLYGELQDEVAEIVQAYEYLPIPDLDTDHIRTAYSRMARKWHPDAGGTHEAMATINEFYQELQQ